MHLDDIVVGLGLPGGPRETYATGGHNLQKTHATELAEALGVDRAYVSRMLRLTSLAPTMVEVSSSAMMAGPLMRAPSFMSKRQ